MAIYTILNYTYTVLYSFAELRVPRLRRFVGPRRSPRRWFRPGQGLHPHQASQVLGTTRQGTRQPRADRV